MHAHLNIIDRKIQIMRAYRKKCVSNNNAMHGTVCSLLIINNRWIIRTGLLLYCRLRQIHTGFQKLGKESIFIVLEILDQNTLIEQSTTLRIIII